MMAMLSAAGVEWVLGGTGTSSEGSRFVWLNAMRAAQVAGADPLTLVTRDAASFLGLPAHGLVRRGAAADVVLWSADPQEPTARVVRVYVDGKVVYEGEQGE